MSAHAPLAFCGEPMFVAEVTVRWGDMDAFRHVNNAAYLVYLEEARLQWMQHVGEWHSETSAPVLAASGVNYRRPITWPTRLHVELRCERIGTSSIIVQHRLVDADQPEQLFSDGNVVLVWMDTTTGKPVAMPDTVRAAAEKALAG